MVVLERDAAAGRGLCIYLCSRVVASSVSFASAQVRKLTHAAAPPFPTKLRFAGAPVRPVGFCPVSKSIFRPCPNKIRLSDVSREQRYNTLDFPRKVVCHETAGFFGFFRSKGNSIPSEHPRQRRTLFPFESPCQQGCYSPLLDDPEPK